MVNNKEIQLNKIALLFWEEAPCEQSGKCIEFVATAKKRVWKGGRDPKECDSEIFINNKWISRIHFTLYSRDNKWHIIDGGVYKDEEVVRPSSNGVWIKSGSKWERIGGQAEIKSGTLIWLGVGFRIVAIADCSNTTLGQFYWVNDNWPRLDKPKSSNVEPAIKKELVNNASVNGWSVLLDLINWLQEKPADRLDLIYKLIILGAMIQLAAIAAFAFYLWRVHPRHQHQPSSFNQSTTAVLLESAEFVGISHVRSR